ncbi:MAG TPA: hypothetical protein PLK15_01955 [Chitinophagales bacterium]|jgi:hypothetical protein|nr:hypothetical protein [Chitinophagales bacterium]
MSTFFVLSDNKPIVPDEQYSGYVLFYKKSTNAATASIQDNLFLKLIEQALKLNLNQFLWVDITKNQTRFSTIIKNVSVQKCFLFGVSEKEIGLNIDLPLYQLKKIKDIEFIKTDSPEDMENNKALKSRLWSQLVISFNISV